MQDFWRPSALNLLPEEILDFSPWIVSLVKSYEKGSTSFALEPPHPFEFKVSNLRLSHDIWTQKAAQQAFHIPAVR